MTFAMMSTNPGLEKSEKPNKEKKKVKPKREPGSLGPHESTTQTRTESTTVQWCGNSNVAVKWFNGHYALGQQFMATIGQIQKTLH